jgi:hypothetical protein
MNIPAATRPARDKYQVTVRPRLPLTLANASSSAAALV